MNISNTELLFSMLDCRKLNFFSFSFSIFKKKKVCDRRYDTTAFVDHLFPSGAFWQSYATYNPAHIYIKSICLRNVSLQHVFLNRCFIAVIFTWLLTNILYIHFKLQQFLFILKCVSKQKQSIKQAVLWLWQKVNHSVFLLSH